MPVDADLCQSLKKGWRKRFCLAGLLLTSCLPLPPLEPIAITPIEGGVKSVALSRPTWDGTGPDRFCEPDIGDEIEWQLKRSMLKRNYELLDFKLPSRKVPDQVAGWSGKEFSLSAPESADAVFRLRIVNYLDASLCDTGRDLKFFGMTAVAEMFDRKNGELIWQTEQNCSDWSRGTKVVIENCTRELVRKITQRLPSATD